MTFLVDGEYAHGPGVFSGVRPFAQDSYVSTLPEHVVASRTRVQAQASSLAKPRPVSRDFRRTPHDPRGRGCSGALRSVRRQKKSGFQCLAVRVCQQRNPHHPSQSLGRLFLVPEIWATISVRTCVPQLSGNTLSHRNHGPDSGPQKGIGSWIASRILGQASGNSAGLECESNFGSSGDSAGWDWRGSGDNTFREGTGRDGTGRDETGRDGTGRDGTRPVLSRPTGRRASRPVWPHLATSRPASDFIMDHGPST